MQQKTFTCITGPIGDTVTIQVQLNGASEDERLTPRLAARAANVAFGHRSGITVWSNDSHGYRLYTKSARKLARE